MNMFVYNAGHQFSLEICEKRHYYKTTTWTHALLDNIGPTKDSSYKLYLGYNEKWPNG